MAITKNQLAYIARETASYKPIAPAHKFKNKEPKVPFLWGDAVYVVSTNKDTTKFSAKGHHFEAKTRDLTDRPILCWWQIDCGQGDAAFIRFPNGKTMMIDAGPGPMMANSPALAPSFLKWMRYVDQSWRDEFGYGGKCFDIDAVVCSHPDYDHYGGFLSMIDDIRARRTRFRNVYHNGLGRFDGGATDFVNGRGISQLGPVEGTTDPELYLTALIDGFSDVKKYSRSSGRRPWKLGSRNGSYGSFLSDLAESEGSGVGTLRRVHAGMGDLPSFDAGDGCRVVVLGPIEESWRGRPAVRYIDKTSKTGMASPSLTRNGVSIVLRIDLGDVRILLTGDLNFRSQALLLNHIPSTEFKCHVAKACHHGSEDVAATFLRAMSPLATLFSSGDNETHAHPRAKVLGMAGAFTNAIGTGKKTYLGLQEDRYVAPLIYSTELSRSVALYRPTVLTGRDEIVSGATLASAGAGGRKGPTKRLRDWLLADSLIYGLINVRTDGSKVLIAVLKEGPNAGFQTESFRVT